MRSLCFGLALMLALPVWGAEIKIDFGDFPTNQIPAGFHSALAGSGQPGDWKVISVPASSTFAPLTPQARRDSVVMQQRVLAQLSPERNEERFPLLIYDKETFHDFKLTTRFKIVSGVDEEMAGVVFRYQNPSNFYVFRASALGHDIRFYKVVDGLRGNFFGPNLNITTNVWHTLAVQCRGNQFKFWYDGQLVMPPLNDNTFAAGKIGFWTMSDAVSYFGDTTITYTPRVPMAQVLVNRMMQKYPRILKLRVYMLNAKGKPQIVASNDKKEIGRPGTNAEKGAIANGTVYFGRRKGVVAVTMPLTDRNGNPIAAVRVELHSFFGETEDSAVTRARVIVIQMQKQVLSKRDLTQ